MFIHLGSGVTVKSRDVIAIMDIEKASTSKDTREYLAKAGKHKPVISLTSDLPKSFVVTLDDELTERVYICGISAETLKKRALKNFGCERYFTKLNFK